MTEVEGGLDEPAELEPEQGSLDLAAPEDDHGRADWEKAAAAVLRKAGRLADDDPDDAAWDEARPDHARRDRGPPARHRRPARRAWPPAGRPTRPADWDIRAHLDIADAKHANEAALVDLDERRHVPVARGRAGRRLRHAARGRAPRPRAGRAGRAGGPAGRRRGLRHLRRRHRPRRRHQPRRRPVRRALRGGLEQARSAPSSTTDAGRGGRAGPRRRDAGARRRRHGGARPGRVRRAGARLLDGRGRGVPPDPHRRRHPARRRGRPDRVPVRRHRRAVPDHRQAARRAPALGARARAERGRAAASSASTSSPAGR